MRTSSVTRRLRGETASSVRGGFGADSGARGRAAPAPSARRTACAFGLGPPWPVPVADRGAGASSRAVVVAAARAVGRFATGLRRERAASRRRCLVVDAADVADFVVRFAAGAWPLALPVARVRGLPATAPVEAVRLPARDRLAAARDAAGARRVAFPLRSVPDWDALFGPALRRGSRLLDKVRLHLLPIPGEAARRRIRAGGLRGLGREAGRS